MNEKLKIELERLRLEERLIKIVDETLENLGSEEIAHLKKLLNKDFCDNFRKLTSEERVKFALMYVNNQLSNLDNNVKSTSAYLADMLITAENKKNNVLELEINNKTR